MIVELTDLMNGIQRVIDGDTTEELWTRTGVIVEKAAGASDLQQERKRGEELGMQEECGTLTRREKRRENQMTLLSPHMGTSYSPRSQ